MVAFRTVVDFWDHADLDEARRECRIQIERAILWGFDVTHLASRAGALTHRPEFFDLLTELCLEFSLPVRLPNADDEAGIGFPLRQLARDDALVSPDRVVRLSELDPAAISDAVDNLAPGVTELVLRPAIDSPELVAIDPDSAMRIRDLDAASPWSELAESLSRAGCRRLSWRDLRAVARPS